MPARLFGVQRTVGEELLAAGWHASSIAIGSKPGSAWVLYDPSRRIRVRMCADLAGVVAEVCATNPPCSPSTASLWRLTIHDAPKAAIITALLGAPCVADGVGTRRDRRRIAGAPQAAGMRCDRGWMMRALSGTATWRSADRTAVATFTIPYRMEPGGWQILTPAAHLEATPGTPAPVLTPLITTPLTLRQDEQP